MSLKKTWFSYVLWLVFAAVTALISYSVLDDVLHDFYSAFHFYTPTFDLYLDIGSKAAFIAIVVLAVILIHFLCGKVKTPTMSKWAGIFLHIVIGLGIVAGFCTLRYSAFNYAYYLQSYSRPPSEQAMYFFELSKVGSSMGNGAMSVFEQVYVSAVRTLFMFFGNKMEVLLLAQLVMQALIFGLLILIGKILQKGIWGWIPALLYAFAPTCFYTTSDTGITNFWTLIVVLGLFVICIFEKAWKKKNITYLVMVFAQLLFIGFVFFVKKDVLLYGAETFVFGEMIPENPGVLTMEMLIVIILLITYCVSFFMDKQDHRCLFVLPFVGYCFLAICMSNYEYEVFYWLAFVALINFFFMIAQSMRTIFRCRPEVVTGKNKALENVETEMPIKQKNEQMEPAKFEWADMQEVMHSTEGIEVRKEEPAKVELPMADVLEEEKRVAEEPAAKMQELVIPIDRKAPIENVLPMPKRHKPKVLDYAFEPTEDLMHYDVEIENDDYDY